MAAPRVRWSKMYQLSYYAGSQRGAEHKVHIRFSISASDSASSNGDCSSRRVSKVVQREL